MKLAEYIQRETLSLAASGTSEGAKKGWDERGREENNPNKRRSIEHYKMASYHDNAATKVFGAPNAKGAGLAHSEAARAHQKAARAHLDLEQKNTRADRQHVKQLSKYANELTDKADALYKP